MAKKLLEMGATSTIHFDDYVKVYLDKNPHALRATHEANMRVFRNSCPQHIIAAAAHDLPKLVRELAEAGADVNELTTSAYEIVENPSRGRYSPGHSLLDIVERKIEQLNKFSADEDGEAEMENIKPETLKEESHYLEGLEPGTYKYWTAQQRYKFAKAANQALASLSNRPDAGSDDRYIPSEEAKAAKAAAVHALLEEFRELKTFLVEKGAKTFKELHNLETSNENDNNRYNQYRRGMDSSYEEYTTKFNFTRPTLSETDKEGYFRLFEAVWRNDEADVKALTLQEWKSEDGKMNPPLQVAVKDSIVSSASSSYYWQTPPPKKQYTFGGLSPFSLAVLKGHRKLAKAIVEIALAQYEPEDALKADKANKWRLLVDHDSDCGYDSDGSDACEEFVHFESVIVNDVYTIDNIAAVSKVVKCNIKPLDMIQWSCNAPWFTAGYDKKLAELVELVSGPDYHKTVATSPSPVTNGLEQLQTSTLLQYVVDTDDISLLRFLYEIAETSAGDRDDSEASPVARLTEGLFDQAIEQGRTTLLAEMIRTTGVPLNVLVQTTGVVVPERKPKYYQGLNVGGKKNKAWADAANPNSGFAYTQDLSRESPPLLKAAKAGSLTSIQWFLTELPALEYMKFAETHKNDKRVKALSEGKEGFKSAITKWLNTRADLVLHCAVLAPASDESLPNLLETLKYLLEIRPELLEKRSLGGLTPLHVACKTARPEIIKLLLDSGADARKKDGHGKNMMHYIIAKHHGHGDGSCLKTRIDIFNPRHVEEMLLEADRDGCLPRQFHGMDRPELELVTEFCSGKDLRIMSPQGEYPLHLAVKNADLGLAKHVLEHVPQQVGWENATGITPLEMVEMKIKTKIAREPHSLNPHTATTIMKISRRLSKRTSRILSPLRRLWRSGRRIRSCRRASEFSRYTI
jgi:hypothetical protein